MSDQTDLLFPMYEAKPEGFCRKIPHGTIHDPLCYQHPNGMKNLMRVAELLTDDAFLETLMRFCIGSISLDACRAAIQEKHATVVRMFQTKMPVENLFVGLIKPLFKVVQGTNTEQDAEESIKGLLGGLTPTGSRKTRRLSQKLANDFERRTASIADKPSSPTERERRREGKEFDRLQMLEAFLDARGVGGRFDDVFDLNGRDALLAKIENASSRVRDIAFEVLLANLDRPSVALELMALKTELLEDADNGLTAEEVSAWIRASRPCPLLKFVAKRRGQLPTETVESPLPNDGLTHEERRAARKKAYEAQRASVEDQDPVSEGRVREDAVDQPAIHRRLDLSDLWPPRKTDPDSVRQLIVYGFFRPGDPSAPSRWGAPVNLETLHVRCDGVPSEHIKAALDELVCERVILAERNDRYLLNQDRNASRFIPALLDRLFALESE